MQEVERNIGQGLYRLTWNTLSIQDYTNNCSLLLMHLEGMVEQVKDFGTRTEIQVKSMNKFDLFKVEFGVEDFDDIIPFKVGFLHIFDKRK